MQKILTALLVLLFCSAPCEVTLSQDIGKKYALLIAGLGGDAEHTDKFKGYLFDTRKALVESLGFEESDVVVLGEARIVEESFVDDLSNAENIRSQFTSLNNKVTSSDDVLIVLFGHGGYEGGIARLNIPRRDLTQNDYADLVGALQARRLVFINTASASAPFIEAIAGEGRIVITATRTGTQTNETLFPQYFVESLTNPGTDRDKDSRISIAEVFAYAAEKTDQWYEDNGHVATENAMISDTGSGEGVRIEDLEVSGTGQVAAFTYLSSGDTALLAAAGGSSPELASWLDEKNQIELDIAELKAQKTQMNIEEYYAALEVLFVRLARGNEQLETAVP
ncbi:MAG: hypothetical protein KTR29_11190 [Rhodothermaceae bacterium]|nr:hypothetical protein [Rhodothermaceae bacterium]